MARTPALSDFQRHIDEIIHKGERNARSEVQDARAYATTHGASRSNRVLISIFESLDKIHADGIERTLQLVGKFTKIAPTLDVETYIPTIRTRMSQFQEGLLAIANGIGLAQDYTRFFNQYATIFRQRLENAIKDIEIGFININESTPQQTKDADRRAILLRLFYQQRHDRSWVAIPSDPTASQQEQIIEANICRQLRDNRLIEFKQPAEGMPQGMGRITALGIDVMEGTAQPSIAITSSSTSTTVRRNFAPDMNFSNFRFAEDMTQAPDNDDDEDRPADSVEFISRLDKVEKELREIKPLVDLYAGNTADVIGIGHNRPPEPTHLPLSQTEYEQALAATAALRAEISATQPKPAVIRLGLSVLYRTSEGIKALLSWAANQGKNFVEAAVKGAGGVAGAAIAAKCSFPTLEAELVEIITHLETWLQHTL